MSFSVSWATNKSGVAAIEFGFIALPFFAILIAVIQIGIVFLAANELQTAVEKAGRQLLTGAAQQANMTQAQFTTAVCANLPVLFTCSGVMVDLQTVSAFSSAVISPPVLTYNSQGQVSKIGLSIPAGPVAFSCCGSSISSRSSSDRLASISSICPTESTS